MNTRIFITFQWFKLDYYGGHRQQAILIQAYSVPTDICTRQTFVQDMTEAERKAMEEHAITGTV